MKTIIIILACCLSAIVSLQAQRAATVTATMSGYQGGKVVDFEFIEKDGINQQIPYSNNQEMEFEAELDYITMMKINGRTSVILQPGDKINVDIKYDYSNGTVALATFTGTPEAVLASTLLQDIQKNRRRNRYKTNILSAVILKRMPLDYYDATKAEWKEEVALLDAIKPQISPAMYNYLLSEIESVLIPNLLRSPWVYAEMMRTTADSCMREDYWNLLDQYKLRDDKASLRNYNYMGFLLEYEMYQQKKKAREQNITHTPPKTLEEAYKGIASFYDGSFRDCALCVLLYNAITKGNDFPTIEKLTKDYFNKYNKNKQFKTMLTNMMK